MGLTLYEWLQKLYVEFGFFREGLVSVVRKGMEGAAEIQQMMVDYRADPPREIAGSPVVKINDFRFQLGASVGNRAQDQVLLRRARRVGIGGRFRPCGGRAGRQDRDD